MGEGKLTPLTTPTPLNRQSQNIAHVITSTISPSQHATFGQDHPRGYYFPYSQSYHSFLCLSFFVSQNLSTHLELRPLNQCWHAIHQYRRVFMYLGVRTQYFHIFTLKTPKKHFWAHIMESLWEIHIRITAWCIEIRCWNLAGCLTLPSTWSTHKSFSVWGTAGG